MNQRLRGWRFLVAAGVIAAAVAAAGAVADVTTRSATIVYAVTSTPPRALPNSIPV
jgi:hypothetical protein